MELFIVSLLTLFVSVFCQQVGNNYNNDFHNHRHHEVRIPSTSERSFESSEESQQIIVNRGSRTFNFEDYEDNVSYDDSLVETIPGKAGKDFPAYTSVPKTSFTCKGRNSGYYADAETGCQVFHICAAGQKISFLCPNGSIFNQKVSVCDWWYDVDCISSSDLIDSNDIQRNPVYNEPNNDYQYQHFIVESDPSYYDLSLASSGGNQNPKYEKQAAKSTKNEQQINDKNSSSEERKRVNIVRKKVNSVNEDHTGQKSS